MLPNNWNAEKKAFRIKFSEGHFFNGAGAMNLQIPADRAYLVESLNSYRAKKFGLLTPEFTFARVYINNRDFGVYLASEPWSKEFLARRGISDSNNIFSNSDDISFNYSLFSENAALDWKSYTKKAGEETGPFEELNALIALVERASDKEFEQKIGDLVDLEKFYRWDIVNLLANSNHQRDYVNTVLLFRSETGKFEFLPWDVHMYMPQEGFYKNNLIIAKRILSRKKFFDEYNKMLRDYVNDENNLKDDLAYYDNLSKELRFEFYKDQAKIDTDYVFDKKIKQYREWIVINFEAAKKRAQLNDFPYPPPVAEKNDNLVFEGSFRFFNDIFANIDVFIARNPQFEKVDDKLALKLLGGQITPARISCALLPLKALKKIGS